MLSAGLRSTDVRSIPPELMNFFPTQAFARLPRDVFQSFSNEQFENFNVEQMKMIPDNLFNSFNKKQITIINQIRYPFKSTGLFSIACLANLCSCVCTFSYFIQ